MIHKFFLVILIMLFAFFNMKIIEKREYVHPLEQLLMIEPVLFKMATNIYSTMYADKFWLLSPQIDEFKKGTGTDWSPNKMAKGYTTINHLDPNFSQPITYAVSYLIINEKEYKLGMSLLNEAINKSPNNPKLLFSKIIYLTTYNPEKVNIEEVMAVANELYKNNVVFNGKYKVSDLIAELVEHYTDTDEAKIKNIKSLYKYVNNEEIHKDLDEILKKYEKEKTDE